MPLVSAPPTDEPGPGFAQAETPGIPMIDDLLRFMTEQQASDLHLKPMRPPLLRVGGKLLPLKQEPLQPDVLREMLESLLTERMRRVLDERLAADFGYSLPGVSRFRCSVFHQRGTLAAVFRRVPFEFPSLEDWGLPEVLHDLARLPQGLVLITGPTGSGKSSTLAALLRLIAQIRLVHIVTIEDPIEFLLKDQLGSITQREVGTDTPSFAEALRNALRQDPDVIMVGEMRDLTTIQTVLTAAETGHLVFSTLHTNSAAQTIDRILDMFPEGNHRQVRQQLSSVLQAVVSLKLVDKADESGLTAAVEILRHTPRAAKLIFEGNLDTLDEEIENSVAYHLMQSMNQSLAALVLNGVITRDTALAASTRPGDLDLLLRKFLYAGQETPTEENDMGASLSDYSKLTELQEIRKLYEETQERHGAELAERDAEIQRLKAELVTVEAGGGGGNTDALRAENERLLRQIQLMRQEYEAKIERLQARLREVLASPGTPQPAADPDRKGFFRR